MFFLFCKKNLQSVFISLGSISSTTQVLLALAYWWLWKINGSARSESSRCEEIGIEKKKPTWADLYTLELQSKTIQPCLLLIVSTDKFHSASYSLQSGTSHAKMALGLILGNIKVQGKHGCRVCYFWSWITLGQLHIFPVPVQGILTGGT